MERDVWAEAMAAAESYDLTGEQPEWDEPLGEVGLMGLLDLLARARTVKRRANIIRNEAKLRAANLVGEGGAVSDGHTFYRYAQGIERQVREPLELLEWLGPDAVNVLRLDDAVSIERFRQLATQRAVAQGVGDEEMVKQHVAEMERHFFSITPTPPDLTEMPLSHQRIPKYAQTMTPGEIRRR